MYTGLKFLIYVMLPVAGVFKVCYKLQLLLSERELCVLVFG